MQDAYVVKGVVWRAVPFPNKVLNWDILVDYEKIMKVL
jgi:hypothetical protein